MQTHPFQFGLGTFFVFVTVVIFTLPLQVQPRLVPHWGELGRIPGDAILKKCAWNHYGWPFSVMRERDAIYRFYVLGFVGNIIVCYLMTTVVVYGYRRLTRSRR